MRFTGHHLELMPHELRVMQLLVATKKDRAVGREFVVVVQMRVAEVVTVRSAGQVLVRVALLGQLRRCQGAVTGDCGGCLDAVAVALVPERAALCAQCAERVVLELHADEREVAVL